MTSFPYTEIAQSAKTLIESTGREITLRKRNRASADPAQPWNGPAAGSDEEVTLTATFVPVSSAQSLGMRIDRIDGASEATQVAIIAPGSPYSGFDLAEADEIIDGSIVSKVTFVETLKPADTVVLYYLGVKR